MWPGQCLAESGPGRAFIAAPALLSSSWANLHRGHSLLLLLLLLTAGLCGPCPSLSQHPPGATPAPPAAQAICSFLPHQILDSHDGNQEFGSRLTCEGWEGLWAGPKEP